MKRIICGLFLNLMTVCLLPAQSTLGISKTGLLDKIKGGWAGQVIGVTFGGPTEFRFTGSMINDYQPIRWYDGYIKETMVNNPGLYDDLYMDLTFVDVFEKKGLKATAADHAEAYAHAGYMLWHANQAGRYNILQGIPSPQSGQWQNNPHADDIDFQIEADFSGLMAPGMPNTAAQIGDPIGHIMNYGDGWYGGVYVGAMYSLSFVSKNVNDVVTEGLKTVPPESTFHQCITDVIQWHKQYPTDWKRTWFEIQKKWSDEVGCPDGVFNAFNIDAKLNSAYIVLGLLYGEGDFTKTMEITTRAGQDSDCNPSSAGGILGTILGYDKIPDYWKMGLKEAESIDFKYTTISLNKVYQLSFKHALQVIAANGGKVTDDAAYITLQAPVPVRLEKSFPDLYPMEKRSVQKEVGKEFTTEIDGSGFVLQGEARPRNGSTWNYAGNFVFQAELYIDGQKKEVAALPVNFTLRRHDLFWNYTLTKGKHTLQVKVLNPDPDYFIQISDIIVYRDQPWKPSKE
jgi:hypothetical protein